MQHFKFHTYAWLFPLVCLIACSSNPSNDPSRYANDSIQPENTPAAEYDTDSTETEDWERPKITAELAPFIPEGYHILYQYNNDMNLDSVKDITLILEVDTSQNDDVLEHIFGTADNNQLSLSRPFLILLRQKDGELKQGARNDVLFSASAVFFFMFAAYFPEPEVSDGQFGYTGFFFHGGGGHSESDIRFEYFPKQKDWLLMEDIFSYVSDTPTEDGHYDNTEGSYHRTQKDFGIIRINEFDGGTD